MINISDDVRVI